MAPRHDRYALISQVASTRDGIITTPDLHDLGFTDAEIYNLAAAGLLHRVRRGVFAVGHEALSDRARWRAMLAAGGPGSALDCMTAAQHWSLTNRRTPLVYVATATRRRQPSGARFHHRPHLLPADCTIHQGLRTVTVTRTIASLGRVMGVGELAGVLREAGHLGRLDLDALEALVALERGRPGIPTLRAALDMRAGGSRGGRASSEQRVYDYLAQFPIEEPAWNVDLGAFGDAWEVDFVFHRSRVYLEVDGPTHDAEDVKHADERQDVMLAAVGWRPFRIDPREFDRDRVATCEPVLRALLAARLRSS